MKRLSILISATSILLFVATGCTKTTNRANNQNTSFGSVATAPTIFYEQQTITGFEPGGTPHGTSVLYRKDGINGTPVAVSSRSDEHVLGNTEYSVKNNHLIRTVQSSTGLWTATQTLTTFDFSVTNISEETQQLLDGIPQARLSTKGGTVIAVATMSCAEEVDAGPCPITFHLKITDSALATEKTFDEKSFSMPNLSGIRAEPIAFSPDQSRLFVFLSGIGESWDPAGIYSIDLKSFAIKNLLQSQAPDLTKDKTRVTRINVLRPSRDGNSIYIERDYEAREGDGELLRLNLQTLDIQKVVSVTTLVQGFQLQPDDSGAILQSSNGGFSLLDFASGQKQVLADQGYFLGWSHDGACYLYQVYDDNGNGLGPFRLMVGSMTTGVQTEIVRQTVTAQSVKTTTKVGDTLYAPVGIW